MFRQRIRARAITRTLPPKPFTILIKVLNLDCYNARPETENNKTRATLNMFSEGTFLVEGD